MKRRNNRKWNNNNDEETVKSEYIPIISLTKNLFIYSGAYMSFLPAQLQSWNQLFHFLYRLYGVRRYALVWYKVVITSFFYDLINGRALRFLNLIWFFVEAIEYPYRWSEESRTSTRGFWTLRNVSKSEKWVKIWGTWLQSAVTNQLLQHMLQSSSRGIWDISIYLILLNFKARFCGSWHH